jgi:cobalt-zinc-cadmium efflux system outer membrane protein
MMKQILASTVIMVIGAPLWLSGQTRQEAPVENPANAPVPGHTLGMELPSAQTLPHPVRQLLEDAAKRPPMTLKNFEDLALATNPTLKQASELVRRSEAQARQASLYPNPSVGYEGSEIRGGSFGGGENGAFVQQTIVLGGKLGLRKRVFQAQQREDETGATAQRYRLLSDVDQGFYSALAAQAIVKLRQTLLTIALDAAQTAHQLANVGQADLPDVLQAEVEADQARVDYTTAQMNYIQVFKTLTATAGKPDLPVSPLEGNLTPWPELKPEQIMETILRESPALKQAHAAVAKAEAQLRSAQREAIPDLQVRAGVQQDSEALNEAAIKPQPVGVVGFASLGISVPLFNRNQGNAVAARAELERAQQEVARVELSLRRSAEPLLRGYLAEVVQANQYKSEMIPKATRAYQLYLNRYRQMAAAYPDVLVSQRTWFELEVSYVGRLEHLWASAIALQNFTLTNGLEAPLSSGSSSTAINLPNGGGGSSGEE